MIEKLITLNLRNTVIVKIIEYSLVPKKHRFTIANPQQLQGGALKKHKIQVLATEIKQNL